MKTLEHKKTVFAYSTIIPLFLVYAFLRLFPILWAFALSLTNRNLFKKQVQFVGLENYIGLFTGDADFTIAFRNTLLFAVLTALSALCLAFFVSFLMNRSLFNGTERKNLIGKGVIQALIFVPVVISVVPSAIIWKWIYDPQFGILNYIIRLFGGQNIGWLVDKNYSMLSIIIYVVWKWMGYYMIIFLVGFSNIPKDFFQAARIDGANDFRILTGIVLPLLAPILYFATVMATIKGFTIFSEVYVMTSGSQGAPGNLVKVLTYDIYERGFFFGKIGVANAEALVLFLLLLLLTLVQMRINKKFEY